MFLNLDPQFKPIQGTEISFTQFTFSGGEPHIKITGTIEKNTDVTVTHRLNSFHALGMLCLAADALKRMEVQLANLVIPYFPAARQDRVMVHGEPFSLKVYADIINALGFRKVTVLDAHSDVTPALLNNCVSITNHVFVEKAYQNIGTRPILISPDGGALKKIYKLAEYLGGVDVVECSKSRDVKTGNLKGFKVYADDLAGRDCLIVDDICDGGGTFIGLAEALQQKNAGKLYLAVTHGIFSKGFDQLDQYYTKLFTTNSIKEFNHPTLTQIAINNGLLF